MSETLEHRETTIEGVRLHRVRAAGPGTPVVLLHGWPQTWYAWRKVIPELARHHEVFAVDLPGLGDSGSSPRGHGVRIAAEADASIPLCTLPDHQGVIWKR
ncbi:hypothetical protein Z951_21105 [Streptomyces sp. PRh5]|uniref:alpha/beta fold hydrolase n=1 Tax=Streptomyces sp. PRh5 TaxID=1158056 RepID=UPI0004474ECA|nr:hypothetical protein Z951_21105 [Streptomyces sp. PRh5]